MVVELPVIPSCWRLHKPYQQLRPLLSAVLNMPKSEVNVYAAPLWLRSNNARVRIWLQISVCWWICCTFLGTTIQHHAYIPCHCSSNILLVIDFVHLSLVLSSDEDDSMVTVFLKATYCILHVLWNVWILLASNWSKCGCCLICYIYTWFKCLFIILQQV